MVLLRTSKLANWSSQLAELTKEQDKLSEQLASHYLDAEEVVEQGRIYRITSKGKDGPFCPNHKDVRLTRMGNGRWICYKCGIPVGY